VDIVKIDWLYDPDQNIETCGTVSVPSGISAAADGVRIEVSRAVQTGPARGRTLHTYTLTFTNWYQSVRGLQFSIPGIHWPMYAWLQRTNALQPGASVRVQAAIMVPI
jgi:hypothetical protein